MHGGLWLIWTGGASILVAAIVLAIQLGVRRHAAQATEPEADPAAMAWASDAIAAADGAGGLVDAALRDADAAIEKARRSGSGTSQMLQLELAGIVRARAGYTCTGDDPLDVLHALALAREAGRVASETAAHGEAFNEWLRTNGHRFMS